MTTHLAHDLVDRREVVIKTIDAALLPRRTRKRVVSEAETLVRLRQMSPAPLLAWGEQGDRLHLVSPHVVGVSLAQHLESGPLSVQRTVEVGRSLAQVLDQVHQHAVLHRNLTPRNVMLQPDGSITPLDFGVSQIDLIPSSLTVSTGVEVIRYVSLEQAGLLHCPVDLRSDLYVVGLLLFECLTGRPPFRGATAGDLLQQQLNHLPPSPRSLGTAVPQALEALVLRLLQKEPTDRYQSAAALLGDLTALARGEELVIGRRDRRKLLTVPTFVGRREELQRLEQALVRARLGEGGLVLLEGEAGAGKTMVLEELARRVAVGSQWVIRGEATDRADQRPFQILDALVRDVLHRASSDSTLQERVRRRVGGLRPVLARILPPLAPLLGTAVLEPTTASEREIHLSLARLLAALGSPACTVVLLLDDIQWCEDVLLGALAQLASRQDGVKCHTAVLVSCQTNDPRSRGLRQVASMQVCLPPLEETQIQELLESMAGPLPPEATSAVTQVCNGNPFMAAAVLWGLVEDDGLVWDGGWRLVRESLPQIQSSRRVGALLARRLTQVSEPVTRVLQAGAVLGSMFDVDHLAVVVDLPRDRTRSLLVEAGQRHLVWCEAERERWHFSHRTLRKHLLSNLPLVETRRLHERAADQLLQHRGPEAAFQLAYHLDEAGKSRMALPFALEAAERARQRCALDVAERQYRIAVRAAAEADDATRFRVHQGLGEILLARNQHDEARQQFGLALTMCSDDLARAAIHRELGQLAFRRGDVELASQALIEGLALTGNPVPRTRRGLIWELGREVLRLVTKRIPARRHTPPQTATDVKRLALSLHEQLPLVWWNHGGLGRALWSHLRRLNLAETCPGSADLARAYAFHARVLGELSLFSLAEHYLERGAAITARLQDPRSKGQVLLTRAMVLYGSARFDAAAEHLARVIDRLEQASDPWQALAAKCVLGHVHLRRGELTLAEAMGRELFEEAVDRDQALPADVGLDLWARASGGRVPHGLIQAELRRVGGDSLRRALVQQAEAMVLLREQAPERAASTLEQAWRETGRARIRREHVFPLVGWMLTAWRLWAASLPSGSPRRATLITRAARFARWGRLLAGRFPNHRPHVLRESGLLAAMNGDLRHARRWLRQSRQVAVAQGARYELAQTLLASARVGWVEGEAGAAAQEQEGYRLLEQSDADFALGQVVPQHEAQPANPPTVALVDRFDQLLEAGRRIVTSLSRESAFLAVREAASSLLRGQCVVLEVASQGEQVHIVSGDPEASISRSLVRQTMQSGASLVVAAGAPITNEASESFMLSGVRSVLTAPIPQRDELRFCLYITHAQVGGLFGREEQRLAGFIASLVAAALENAKNYNELEIAFEALRRAHGDLKSTQSQLVQAAKLAALGQLGAGIAHELNQPIQSIQGFAQRIERHAEDPVEQHMDELKIIINATHRMARIVRNIRLFARDGELELQPLDPTAPVREALMLLSRQLQKSKIDVSWARPMEFPRVMGDLGKLQQVFLNLFLNARDVLDTLPLGAPRRVVLGGMVEHDRVMLTVADSGPGVPVEHEGRIFDPFFTTKDAGQGTGLGLSISYGIIKAHGGELVHERGQTGGAVFTVVLPRTGPRN